MTTESGQRFVAYHADTIDVARAMPDASVDFDADVRRHPQKGPQLREKLDGFCAGYVAHTHDHGRPRKALK